MRTINVYKLHVSYFCPNFLNEAFDENEDTFFSKIVKVQSVLKKRWKIFFKTKSTVHFKD